MARKHKKSAVISIKTSKFLTSHVEPLALAGNRIFSGTALNVNELKLVYYDYSITDRHNQS